MHLYPLVRRWFQGRSRQAKVNSRCRWGIAGAAAISPRLGEANIGGVGDNKGDRDRIDHRGTLLLAAHDL